MMTNIGAAGVLVALALAPQPRTTGKPVPPASSWADWLLGRKPQPAPTVTRVAPPVRPDPLPPPGPPPTGPRTPADDFVGGGIARREGVGLRLTTPRPFPNAPRSWTSNAPYALGGDFEFSAAFSNVRIGVTGDPVTDEGNSELGLIEPGRGHVAMSVAVSPGQGPCINVGRHAPNRQGMHWNTLHFPRKSDAGRVCIRRRGGELIFLAADGPDAALVELVRYPADPRLSPIPRVSAYQSHGKVAVPVDVLWTDFVVQADRVNRDPGYDRPLPPATPPASYPVAIHYKSPKDLLADFPHGDDGGKAFRADGAAVRFGPPVLPHRKGAQTYWFRDSRYQVDGDFEISCLVAVDRLDPAGPGSASVSLGLETGGPLGSVSLGRNATRDGGSYAVTRYNPTRKGSVWDTQRVKTAATKCRLVMRRTGSEIAMLTQEDGEPAPRELVRFPVMAGPIPRVRLIASQGDTTAAAVAAAVTEFTVRAARLTDADGRDLVAPQAAAPSPGSPAADEVVLDAAPRSTSRKWLYLGVGAAVAVAGTVAAAAVFTARSRRRPAPRSPS